jgi:hypothetical protein
MVTAFLYPGSQSIQPDQPSFPPENSSLSVFRQIYESLNDSTLNAGAFLTGMLGLKSLAAQQLVANDSLLTIIDFSLPSSEERFFVINILRKSILYKSLVAHGKNSGELFANRFSNRIQSHQSALGFYITGSPYGGSQGYSMLLNGVDTGYNDQARLRAIVVHGAQYATRNYIEKYGRLGRSFGCPALPPDKNDKIINLIKDGSVLFSYYPDQVYLESSSVLGRLPKEMPLSALSL